MGSHRHVPHTSEVELEIEGRDLGDLLGEATLALGDLLAPTRGTAAAPIERGVTVESVDRAALLVDWLNELVFLAETERFVPDRLARVALEPTATGVRAEARVVGRVLPEAPWRVKAATMHGLEVTDHDGELRARVVIDV